jgi:hypothetical protein
MPPGLVFQWSGPCHRPPNGQLATVTLATTNGWFGTWIGSTVGMVAADAQAIAVGAMLGKHLPEKAIKIGASVLFFAFGLWLLAEALSAKRQAHENCCRPEQAVTAAHECRVQSPTVVGRRLPALWAAYAVVRSCRQAAARTTGGDHNPAIPGAWPARQTPAKVNEGLQRRN